MGKNGHVRFSDETQQAALFETMILAAGSDGDVSKVEVEEIYRRVFERPEFQGIQASDLRQAIAHAQLRDQFSELWEHCGHVRRQDRTRGHVRDIARLAFMKADQHTALLRHIAYGQSRAIAITPGRAGDRREQRIRAHATDSFQRVLERPLLRRELQRFVGVLQHAATTDAKMRTTRRHARGARPLDRCRTRNVEARLALEHFGVDALARQRALDEHDLAVGVCDAAAFLVQRFDRELDHVERRGLYAPVP
jgi:hypothetical protein